MADETVAEGARAGAGAGEEEEGGRANLSKMVEAVDAELRGEGVPGGGTEKTEEDRRGWKGGVGERGGGGGALSGAAHGMYGMEKKNVVPLPSSDTKSSLPRISLTSCLLRLSPMPAPPIPEAEPLTSCTNGFIALSWNSLLIPLPVSIT